MAPGTNISNLIATAEAAGTTAGQTITAALAPTPPPGGTQGA